MVETSGNGNASNLINLKRPFNNTRINASDIGTRHSDPKSIIPFGNPVIFDTFTIANLNQESYYAGYSISKCFFFNSYISNSQSCAIRKNSHSFNTFSIANLNKTSYSIQGTYPISIFFFQIPTQQYKYKTIQNKTFSSAISEWNYQFWFTVR